MRRVPIGYDDFMDLRENDLYYVDKTGLIREIVSNSNIKVFLFTRPRRFGKSLNMSMIDAFFNLEYRGNTWFEGLDVMSCPECVELMNQNPVISISLKCLNKSDYDTFLADFREMIRGIGEDFSNSMKNEPEIPDVIRNMMYGDMSESSLKTSLKDLSRALYDFHGEKWSSS